VTRHYTPTAHEQIPDKGQALIEYGIEAALAYRSDYDADEMCEFFRRWLGWPREQWDHAVELLTDLADEVHQARLVHDMRRLDTAMQEHADHLTALAEGPRGGLMALADAVREPRDELAERRAAR
jgi:hypothetical protein